MDFKTASPHFHQAAIATAFTLSIVSPVTSWAEDCSPTVDQLVVNIATDSDDACDDQISLREAITYANQIAGKDAITFADSLNGQVIDATQAAIEITESVSITGPTNDDSDENAELITLKASDDAPLFSIESTENKIDFDLSNTILEKSLGDDHIIEMEVFGGDIILDNIQTTEATQAGGIFSGGSMGNNQQSEQGDDLNLTLKNSTISGSIFSSHVLTTRIRSNSGNNLLTIEDTTFNNIHASSIANLYSSTEETNSTIQFVRSNITGSTVYKIAEIYSYYSSANIDVIESTISGNTVSNIGLRAKGWKDGTFNIQDSILNDNLVSSSPYAISYALIGSFYKTNLKVSNSEIINNQQPAIQVSSWWSPNALANIENTIISNNDSYGNGAGINVYTKGSKLDLNVINSSISNNKTLEHGGGIFLEATRESEINLTLTNSTISNNQAGFELASESDSESMGGGIISIPNSDSIISIDINSTTISHNTASGLGGGIADYYGTSNIKVNNSIIANNVSGAESNQDLLGNFTINHSLVGDTSTTEGTTTINEVVISSIGTGEGQTPDTGNNILGQNPLLQELTFSGGTWVHPLNADSPAIAAGNADIEDLPEFDQRGEGFARVRSLDGSSELDMGAVQYSANPVALNDTISVAQDSENNSIVVLENDAQNSEGIAFEVGSVAIMTHPENGSAEALADGSISYSPNADFFGTDSLVYIVQDIDGNTSSEATVNITIEESTADERDTDTDIGGDTEASDSGGGPLHFWWLSLLAVFGLRRK